MNLKKDAEEVINALQAGRFLAECPSCKETMRLKDAGLFYLDEFTPEAQALYGQRQAEQKERERELKRARKQVTVRVESTTLAVNLGFILERLAPTMPGFRFHRSDCRSLFDPIDYIVFEGLSRKAAVERIIFTEIKTGGAVLAKKQKEIKSLVERRQVVCDLYKAGVDDEK
jgi:predicted Holliday junction resolvase-like endonuclease